MTEIDTQWARARLALQLLAVSPAALGGLHLRARSGPVREAFLEGLAMLPLPRRRLHPGIDDTTLFGGLDLSATLAAGRPAMSRGLLAEPSALVLSMAERTPVALAGRLAQALDGGTHALILLDEGAGPDETAPAALTDRLAFSIDLDDTGWHATGPLWSAGLAAARARVAQVTLPEDAAPALVALAARFGVAGARAPLFAMAVTRAHAALAGRQCATQDDLAAAAGLVYPPRATQTPAEPDQPPPEPPDTGETAEDGETGGDQPPDDMLVEAVAANLPPDLLAALSAGPAHRGTGSGAGAARRGNRRGRPLPSRQGRPDGRSRIDVIATLRAAAPFQTLRRGTGDGLKIRPADIRLRRFEERSDRLIIFLVDASGSAAMARLAEAKGAVERLLGEAYARRDHVALIAFRDTGAQTLLPPTRSLVQAKRRLGGLPGGGATPLAAGLREALALALRARGRGMTPTIALITDGRANVALDGARDRATAAQDATAMARALRTCGVQGLVLDAAARPQPALQALAKAMGARYVALPRADAHGLGRTVADAMEA